jgi:hypothetical protein
MRSDITQAEFARVTVDAVAGAGFVLRQGDIVERNKLGSYFDALVENGAVELVENDPTVVGKSHAELL